jgi:hypothetical protein
MWRFKKTNVVVNQCACHTKIYNDDIQTNVGDNEMSGRESVVISILLWIAKIVVCVCG